MQWLAFVSRTMCGVMLAGFSCLLLPLGASAQTPTPQTKLPEQEDQVPVELYQAPKAKKIDVPECAGGRLDSNACQVLRSGMEGWVELGFMVDPSGRPFEVTVIHSTGVKAFEDLAVHALKYSTFVPGTLDGKPVESGSEMKYVFRNDDSGSASSLFVRAYNELRQAVAAGDHGAADSAIKQLHPINFYEDAYFGLASYLYASKWGDEWQQLAGLRRAIAYEDSPRFLPKALFENVLMSDLKLETDLHLYAEALATAKTLQRNGFDKKNGYDKTAAQIASVVEELQKLRSDGSAYAVQGSMPDGTWHLHLFKQHFRAQVSDGYISQVKLRCPTRYVSFTFDPKLQYTVSSKYGSCAIELDGAPGTRFELVQF